jgi:hypothetical protein
MADTRERGGEEVIRRACAEDGFVAACDGCGERDVFLAKDEYCARVLFDEQNGGRRDDGRMLCWTCRVEEAKR